MSYEKQLRDATNKDFGVGQYLDQLPQSVPVDYADFSGGLDLRDAGDKLPPNVTQDSLDMEVDSRNRLTRVPGTIAVETFFGRTPVQMVAQGTLDHTAELVIFDPPYLGVKYDQYTVWLDVSLPVGNPVFAVTNYAGTLLFSNGKVGTYAREPRSATVRLVEDAPAAAALAVTAARVFAANCVISGELEPLGVRWTAADSDYTDWSGRGSGAELLIDDNSASDRIVAAVPMSLDLTAFVMTSNIWVGTKTGLVDRPLDFQPRVPRIGFVSSQACDMTPIGLVGLSEAGLYAFDGNGVAPLSAQINPALLPLDKERLGEYVVKYDWEAKIIFVITPVESWLFDLEHQRWSRRSIRAAGLELFAQQFGPTTWGSLGAIEWSGLADHAWQDYRSSEAEVAKRYYLLRAGGDVALATESELADSNVGVPLQPHWQLSSQFGAGTRSLMTVQETLVRYFGNGTFDLQYMDRKGVFRLLRRVELTENSEYGRTAPVSGMFTGRNPVARLRILSSTLKIVSLHLKVLPRSQEVWRKP